MLITGGAGFIGSHTADALLAAGHRVRVLDLLDPQVHGEGAEFPSYLHPEVESVRGDVREPADVARALEGVDAVFHLAALTGVGQSMYALRSYVDTNCTGTATLLEALASSGRRVRRLVLASSRAVYGEGTHRCPTHGVLYPPLRSRESLGRGQFQLRCPKCDAPLKPLPTGEDRPLYPGSVYARTKLVQEDLCRLAADSVGLPITILRYFNVYGSRQSLRNPYTGLVSIFYSRLMAGAPISLYEGGQPGRDFVHVCDVVQANLRALESDLPTGTTLNVGSGSRSTVEEAARVLAKVCGVTPRLEDRGEYRVGDVRTCYADVGRARALLGYVPTVDLEQGLTEFVAWARGQPSLDLYAQATDELARHGLFGRARAGR